MLSSVRHGSRACAGCRVMPAPHGHRSPWRRWPFACQGLAAPPPRATERSGPQAPRPQSHLNHVRQLLTRNPGDAGEGGGAESGAGVDGEILDTLDPGCPPVRSRDGLPSSLSPGHEPVAHLEDEDALEGIAVAVSRLASTTQRSSLRHAARRDARQRGEAAVDLAPILPPTMRSPDCGHSITTSSANTLSSPQGHWRSARRRAPRRSPVRRLTHLRPPLGAGTGARPVRQHALLGGLSTRPAFAAALAVATRGQRPSGERRESARFGREWAQSERPRKRPCAGEIVGGGDRSRTGDGGFADVRRRCAASSQLVCDCAAQSRFLSQLMTVCGRP